MDRAFFPSYSEKAIFRPGPVLELLDETKVNQFRDRNHLVRSKNFPKN